MPTYRAQLVGVSFRPAEAKVIVEALSPGDKLKLEREPYNPHDANAIKVWTDYGDEVTDVFLGYIERGIAMALSPTIDEGTSFHVTVYARLSSWSVLLNLEEVEPETAE